MKPFRLPVLGFDFCADIFCEQNWSPTTDHSEYELKPCTVCSAFAVIHPKCLKEDEVAQCFELLQRHNPSSGGFHQTVKFSFIPITESVVRARAAEGRAFILQHRSVFVMSVFLDWDQRQQHRSCITSPRYQLQANRLWQGYDAVSVTLQKSDPLKTQFCGSIFSEKDHQTAFAGLSWAPCDNVLTSC